MWTKIARPQGQTVEMEQLGVGAAIGRYGATALRGLTTGLILGAAFTAFYHLGFVQGAIITAALIGARHFALKKLM